LNVGLASYETAFYVVIYIFIYSLFNEAVATLRKTAEHGNPFNR
jgi:hypothetical protein